MGGLLCKSKDQIKADDDAKVYDPRLIYYDDDGNLRFG